MPPYLRTPSSSGVDRLTISIPSGHLLEAFLLLCAFIITIRSLTVLCTRKKSSMSPSESPSSGKQGTAHTVFKKADSGTGSNDSNSPEPSQVNDYLQSLQQETRRPQLIPVHPWIAPPTPLPGPFDAPYYPLPLPTIHPHPSKSPTIDRVENSLRGASTDSTSSSDSEMLLTRPYTRRFLEYRGLPFDPILERSTTISTAGWRRTQWTVSAG